MDRRSDPVVSVLLRARKLIERPEQWKQYAGQCLSRRQINEPSCIAEAVAQAGYYREVVTEALLYVGDAIDARRLVASDERHDQIFAWNDAPERTHPEVLAAIDKAIALRAQEIA